MSRCLDCGYLYDSGIGDGEYPQDVRKELREAAKRIADGQSWPEDVETISAYLDCFRRCADFPGKGLPREPIVRRLGLRSSPDILEKESKEAGERSIRRLEAVTQDWDCSLYAAHTPGLKPSEQLSIELNEASESRRHGTSVRIAIATAVVSALGLIWQYREDIVSSLKNIVSHLTR